MTPSVLRLMSSELMLCVLLCNRLATSLTTFSLVFPTGGSSTPQVVFMTFLCGRRVKMRNTGFLLKLQQSWNSSTNLRSLIRRVEGSFVKTGFLNHLELLQPRIPHF